jgi:hypothetical protein
MPDLKDLPLELFQELLREMILTRGITRGVRLRLVNRTYAYFSLRQCAYIPRALL